MLIIALYIIFKNNLNNLPDEDLRNRQENPSEYYHSVCGDSDGLAEWGS